MCAFVLLHFLSSLVLAQFGLDGERRKREARRAARSLRFFLVCVGVAAEERKRARSRECAQKLEQKQERAVAWLRGCGKGGFFLRKSESIVVAWGKKGNTMSRPSVREMMKKFSNDATPLTPEAQAHKMKEAEESSKQAVKIARARAARYNMTLRALDISHAMKQRKMEEDERAKVKEAMAKAAKINLTSRALGIVGARNHRNLSRAFDSEVSPAVAKSLIRAVAEAQAKAVQSLEDVEDEKKQMETAAQLLKDIPEIESETEEEVEEEAGSVKAEPLNSGKDADEEEDEENDSSFLNDSLASSLAKSDDDSVNRTILIDFLETHNPSRLDEVDELLEEYKGEKISVLFEELMESTPDPGESIMEGEQKAIENAKKLYHAEKEHEHEEEEQDGEEDNEADAEAEAEEDDEDDEDDEDEPIGAIEQARRDAQEAERREKEKISAMTEEERGKYFQEQEERKKHMEKKDAMLKSQLDLYSKGGSKKNPVLAGMGTKKGAAKRLSKSVERERSKSKSKQRQPSVLGKGFILSGKVDSKPNEDDDSVASSPQGGAKWAVNVQPRLLRERMKKAGVKDEDIDSLLAEESDML